MQKKGFTLMEILVVVLIIGILFAMYSASYNNTKINRKNEKAVAMFVEFANAARLFNEMFPNQRIVGTFGNSISADCPGCLNPCALFPEFHSNQEVVEYLHSFGLRMAEWNLRNINNCSTNFNYEGYTFTLCNPYGLENDEDTVAQPSELCDNSTNMPGVKFAVMSVPNEAKYGSKYANRHIWITKGYEIKNDFNATTTDSNTTTTESNTGEGSEG